MLKKSKQQALQFLRKIKRSAIVLDVLLSNFGIRKKSQNC